MRRVGQGDGVLGLRGRFLGRSHGGGRSRWKGACVGAKGLKACGPEGKSGRKKLQRSKQRKRRKTGEETGLGWVSSKKKKRIRKMDDG